MERLLGDEIASGDPVLQTGIDGFGGCEARCVCGLGWVSSLASSTGFWQQFAPLPFAPSPGSWLVIPFALQFRPCALVHPCAPFLCLSLCVSVSVSDALYCRSAERQARQITTSRNADHPSCFRVAVHLSLPTCLTTLSPGIPCV